MDASMVVTGAGPFGLAVAADAHRHGVDVRLLGEPMSFWRRHMPAGMILRSASDWHLDVAGELTIERFLAERGMRPADVEPLPLELYLAYTDWFCDRATLRPEPYEVTGLRVAGDGTFEVDLGDHALTAAAVVLAVGMRSFAHEPAELVARLPVGRWSHTSDLADLTGLRGRRCLVIGGRQSAYEWSALLLEAGARDVTLVSRHASPAFAPSEWEWATARANELQRDPGWWRRLPEPEQRQVAARMYTEGRLKVEPWLEPRLQSSAFRVLPHRTVLAVGESPDGSLLAELDDGRELPTDQVVLATGYRVDVSALPFLHDLLPSLAQSGGCPCLDEGFQTSIPGLFVTGALATADFGPFFGFTVAARPAAAVLGAALRRHLAGISP